MIAESLLLRRAIDELIALAGRFHLTLSLDWGDVSSAHPLRVVCAWCNFDPADCPKNVFKQIVRFLEALSVIVLARMAQSL
jgi:hypothetical protein